MSNPEGIGETRGRRQKAEVISRAETRQAGRGQTSTEAEPGAGLNAARLSQVWSVSLMRGCGRLAEWSRDR